MLLKNAEMMNENFELEKSDILIENGTIKAVESNLTAEGEILELSGFTVLPGFVDIHIHGCAGFDVCDGTREAVEKIAAHLLKQGVTSFCPTTMTVSPEQIEQVLLNIKACMDNPTEGAAILGVNMEGPYISVKKKGGQNGEFVKAPDWAQFKRYYEISGGIVKLVDIAPECVGTTDFIANASKLCRVSIAHTEANYEQAKEAFRQGVTQVTHLFNAMPGFSHREPGTVGAVFEDDRIKAELICDGFHIHPASLRIAFRILGEDRTIIVSDAMRAAGLPDGAYELGGQLVEVTDGHARLADGTIAGSTTNLYEEVKNLIDFGVPFKQVIKSATINPAKAIGADKTVGSIAVGKRADLLVFDRDFRLRAVIAKGKVLQNTLKK